MFFLYLYPFDFKTNPKTKDDMGMGVIKKNIHIFSVNNPFISVMAPTKTIAHNIDNSEKTNNKIDVTRNFSGIGVSTVLEGFLYIYE